MELTMKAVGRVEGGRNEAIDDNWGASRAHIALDPAQFDATALAGLDGFSHAEIVYVFDRVTDDEIVKTARHPRGRTDWPKIGIFAQRGSFILEGRRAEQHVSKQIQKFTDILGHIRFAWHDQRPSVRQMI